MSTTDSIHTHAGTAGTESSTPRAGRRQWLGLVLLMLPVLLISVDNTVLSFALPAISLDLRPSSTTLLWIVDIYPLVLAGLLVAMGTLGDRVGRRRLLLIGATGFGVVSAAAAFAPTAELLIAARAVMGFFGAMIMPSTLSLLRSLFRMPASAPWPSRCGPAPSRPAPASAPSSAAWCSSTSTGARCSSSRCRSCCHCSSSRRC